MTGVCIRGSFSPRIVYIPFVDMVRGPVDTVLNILLFIPLGFFLPLLYEKYNNISKIAFAAVLISLSVEIAQIKRKYADINNNLIAIDDFGTGINNFDVIDAANPDIVKIDRTLLTDIDKDKYRQEQLREIIDTFHARKISVVAEGIETEGEFETMKELGADFFQGYYLKRPS